MKRAMGAVLGFLCVSGIAQAEPGPVVNYLMDNEVSLFSFGLYRLNADVGELGTQNPAFFSAAYDWESNRINLLAVSLKRNMEPTAENCGALINVIRAYGFIDTNTGKLIEGMDFSRYAEMFDPIGYARKDAPEQHLSKIDEIIQIKASIWDGKKRIACEGPLISLKVLIDTGE